MTDKEEKLELINHYVDLVEEAGQRIYLTPLSDPDRAEIYAEFQALCRRVRQLTGKLQ